MENMSRNELLELERIPDGELGEMLASAAAMRHDRGAVSFCAIINARSGHCSEDCGYCAQSAHRKHPAAGWPLLSPEEIAERAASAAASGVARFGIVTSGRGPDATDLAVFSAAIRHIRALPDGPLPCLSPGITTARDLAALKESGLVRLHHNLETSERFFPRICSTHSWQERFATALSAKEAGLELCAGGLFGIGETFADRVDLALALGKLEPDSVPINFFVTGGPDLLPGVRPLSLPDMLRVIALFRFALPASSLRLCGGRGLLGRDIATALGIVDALMTGDYLTTSGEDTARDRALLDSLGLALRQETARPD